MNQTIVPGQPATVSALALNTGHIDAGHFVEPYVDEDIFSTISSDTPLMNLMLLTKPTKVTSPEVDHYMIDEPCNMIRTTAQVGNSSQTQIILPLELNQQALVRPGSTLLVHGVDGYTPDGQDRTPGKWLMLFVLDHDTTTGNPVCRSINGPRINPADEYTTVPKIPAGTKLSILSNALYETQKEVEPDLIVPTPSRVYLQKRGMNQVVSDYFEAQKKRIPFAKAVIAEQAIREFKLRGNRTLWAGRPGKFKINVPKLGMQYVYTTEGLRWQFKRNLISPDSWTMEHLIALAKMFFTEEDVPKTAMLLAGKNLMEQLAKCDFSKHPEVRMETKVNRYGWVVQVITTIFGQIEFVHDPSLDSLGWNNSGALIGEDRIAHYIYREEHEFSERMEGQEASREGVIVWDALALKGKCHIWIDGEKMGVQNNLGADPVIMMWDRHETPAADEAYNHFYLLCDCPSMSPDAVAGQVWTGVRTVVGSGSDRQEIVKWQRVN